MKQKGKKILILGASGWLGGYIIKAFQKIYPNVILFGTYGNNPRDLDQQYILFDYHAPEKVFQFINHIRPDIIINALRGTDDSLFFFERRIIEQIKDAQIFYSYISSSMIFDGVLDGPHAENDTPKGVSIYGKFKERCEKEIQKNLKKYAIFRFSAVHGFDKNKMSRTERFLHKLKAGEVIKVDTGVIQNRLEITDLTEMITGISFLEANGVFHLGTIDQSEEFEFLRNVAGAFGFSSDTMKSVDQSQKKILTTLPKNIFNTLSDDYRLYEADTVNKIAMIPEFQKYKNV